MKAFSDHEPPRLEAVGNGDWYYRWDIKEVESPSHGMDGSAETETHTHWECQEVVFSLPMTALHVAVVAAAEAGIEEGGEGWEDFYREVASVIVPHDLEAARRDLLERITAYDASPAVNTFSFGGYAMWLDKATRVGLKLRFEAEIRQGKEQTTLWLDGLAFTLPLTGDGNAPDVLDAIELYASACYDVTQQHLAEVASIATADELIAYDITAGYPAQLSFG